jgi:hypothetical protein
MKMVRRRIIALAVLAAVGASVAQAAVDSQIVNVTPSSAGVSGLTFSLPTFNTSLGTLNSVELILTPVLGACGNSALNLSSSAQTISGTTENPTGIGSLNNSALGLSATYANSSGVLPSPTFTAAAGPGVITQGPGLPFSWIITQSSTELATAAYSALGSSLAFTGISPSFASTGGDGTWAVGGYGNVGGSLEVNFNYSAVPEPVTTTAFAGLSALGLLLVTMRSKFSWLVG